jgi:uncharacterized protein (TIGR00369 family)
VDADIDTDIDLRRTAEIMLRSPQAIALGLRLVGIERWTVSIEAPWREDLVGDPERGVIAGGVVTTLLDHVCATTLMSVRKGGGPTLDMRVDYMRPAAPRAGVVSEAHCYKLTRSIAFVRATAWDLDRSDPIATAQAAFSVPERRKA